MASDLREALFLKIQSFSFGNLDHINTGQLMVRLSSDTTAFQRMVQVSLRIGTTGTVADDRQPDPDVCYGQPSGVDDSACVAGDLAGHCIFRLAHGTVVHDRPKEIGPTEYGLTGKYRGREIGQGICARRPRRRSALQ